MEIYTSTDISSIRAVSDDYQVVVTTMVIEKVRGMKAEVEVEVEVTAGVEPRRFNTSPCFKRDSAPSASASVHLDPRPWRPPLPYLPTI